MKNNLENIQKSDVTSADGIKYTDFKKQFSPNFLKVWADILLGYLALVGIMYLIVYLETTFPQLFFITVPLAAFLIGYSIAYLQLFLHEAAHYNIHPNRKINDFLANIFFGALTGTHIKSYRIIHWDHHRFLGTPKDSEHSYFNALNTRLVLESLTGVHAFRVWWSRKKRVRKEIASSSSLRENLMLLAGILLNASILVGAFLLGCWQASITWLLAMLVCFPFFASLRQLLEHRDEGAKQETDFEKVPHGKVSRIFKNSFFSNTFGGAGFNKHMLHHWDPQVSYTNYAEVEKFLLLSPQCRSIIRKSQTTYWEIFTKLFSY